MTSWEYEYTGELFWLFSAIAAFVTSLYSTRLIGVVFFGSSASEVEDKSGLNMSLPLCILSVLALGGGWFGFSIVDNVLPDQGIYGVSHDGILPLVTAGIPIVGVAFGYLIFVRKIRLFSFWRESILIQKLNAFLFQGWGFDTLYDRIIVSPFIRVAKANSRDVIDRAYDFIVVLVRGANQIFTATQTGRLRWYALNMALGISIILLILLEVL